MITLVKSEKNTMVGDYVKILAEFRGLSTDVKPIMFGEQKVENGSIFIEIDTGKVYFYDLENEQWMEV